MPLAASRIFRCCHDHYYSYAANYVSFGNIVKHICLIDKLAASEWFSLQYAPLFTMLDFVAHLGELDNCYGKLQAPAYRNGLNNSKQNGGHETSPLGSRAAGNPSDTPLM